MSQKFFIIPFFLRVTKSIFVTVRFTKLTQVLSENFSTFPAFKPMIVKFNGWKDKNDYLIKPKVQGQSRESKHKGRNRLDKKSKGNRCGSQERQESGLLQERQTYCETKTPGPTPRLQQTSQGSQLKEAKHLNSQLIGSTLGVKCHV